MTFLQRFKKSFALASTSVSLLSGPGFAFDLPAVPVIYADREGAPAPDVSGPLIDGQPMVLVAAKRLNIVNNPTELERWWYDVINTEIGRGVLDAVSSYFGCPHCGTVSVRAIDLAVHQEDAGIEHHGWIQAPVGYTIHSAWVDNPSMNCNGTLAGSYRIASDRDSAGIDGLHWYMVVPQPGIGEGRCWVDGQVNVVFVLADARNPALASVNQTGTIAFHYGK